MVYEQTTAKQVLIQKLMQELKAPTLKTRLPFLQLIAREGFGARRVAFHFLKADQKVVWISPKWKLYAPSLWKLAHQYDLRLYGLECDQRRLRNLFLELRDAAYFDVWILDDFRMSMAEGHFLQKLFIQIPAPKIIFIGQQPHSFCSERVYVHPSENSYRLSWSKGGPPNPQFMSSDFLNSMHDDWKEWKECL